jgi:hypothetical protein
MLIVVCHYFNPLTAQLEATHAERTN